MQRPALLILLFAFILACREQPGQVADTGMPVVRPQLEVRHASGLSIRKNKEGITFLHVASPWPDAQKGFRYALVPKALYGSVALDRDLYDAIIPVPVERMVVTSTTHIPALEALGVGDRIVGFPETRYISSSATRARVASGAIAEVGSNEALNTEIVLALQPDLLIGFGVSGRNRTYDVLQQTGIPVAYNGDWTEQTPLGKAEWIKFFAPFFGLEQKADSLFTRIEEGYQDARTLAAGASHKPTVFSGALYKDVWYLPGGGSWAAQFLKDANATYLWADSEEVGSLALSVESVIERARNAEFWISPSQYTAYSEMEAANRHYSQFRAFQNKQVYTFARTTGATGGYLYYELAPNRPDLVLRDLIHILHPGVLPDHEPYFFKPLK